MPLYAAACVCAGMSSIRTRWPPVSSGSSVPVPARRAASRSPSPSAAHTHSVEASEPIAESPDTSPPPPRLASSPPPGSSPYETGPRLEATRMRALSAETAMRAT
ncbi:hypothetical protein SDIAM26S_02558 [Streptomyces diastaticus subsp. diastaticus]